ncbi:MAG: TonB-dependent receptor [Sphingomonadales bacterium]|nr:TonB-dependent receptor [Sphingomonadales bacterium]
MRGGESSQTLVLIDGVRINDPSSPNAAFDFGSLLTGNINRVEILRGPNSVIWGSQAIGGVVNVRTEEPSERSRPMPAPNMAIAIPPRRSESFRDKRNALRQCRRQLLSNRWDFGAGCRIRARRIPEFSRERKAEARLQRYALARSARLLQSRVALSSTIRLAPRPTPFPKPGTGGSSAMSASMPTFLGGRFRNRIAYTRVPISTGAGSNRTCHSASTSTRSKARSTASNITVHSISPMPRR